VMKFQYKIPDNSYEIRTVIIVLMQSLPLVSTLSRTIPIYTLYFPVNFTIILPSISSVFQVISFYPQIFEGKILCFYHISQIFYVRRQF